MMDLWQDLKKITTLLEDSRPKLLLFDFDGTLTPITKRPRDANLPPDTKILLKKLSKKKNVYLAVVSGRKLDDIKEKIGLPDIIYGGNHGLEGEIFGEKYSYPIPDKMLLALKAVKEQLNLISVRYEGTLVEDKGLSLSFHYRLAEEQQIPEIILLLNKVLQPYITNKSISVMLGKKITDISPNINWNKGRFAAMLSQKIADRMKEKPVVIIIGDDTTDEDVFQTFEKGISIRVGTKSSSYAKYRIKDTEDVFKFLKYINLVARMDVMWKGLVRDASGRYQKYHKIGIKYFKHGTQPTPDLSDKEQLDLLESSISSEKFFIEGLKNKSYKNIKNWLIRLHMIQSYKGRKGKILTKRRISRGEHSKIVKLAILPLVRKYADPYQNKDVQTLYLPNIGDEGLPIDQWKNPNSVKHYYPDPGFFDQYLLTMKKTLEEFMDNINHSDKNKLFLLIAQYYQYAINMHMFEHVNQTLFCNQLNAMLKLIGRNPIEQGVLDFAAMRLQPKNFAKYFIDEVKKIE